MNNKITLAFLVAILMIIVAYGVETGNLSIDKIKDMFPATVEETNTGITNEEGETAINDTLTGTIDFDARIVDEIVEEVTSTGDLLK